jgi:hypothetical protein
MSHMMVATKFISTIYYDEQVKTILRGVVPARGTIPYIRIPEKVVFIPCRGPSAVGCGTPIMCVRPLRSKK